MLINLEAEKSVLGGILIDGRAAATAIAEVTVDDFGLESHKDIYRAILRLNSEGVNIDAVTLISMLEREGTAHKVGGFKYVTDLTIFTPSAANIEQYIREIQGNRQLRELEAAGETIKAKANDRDDDALEYAEKAIFDISSRRERSELRPIGADALNALSEYIDDNGKSNIPTGFYDLDGLMNGGLRRKSLIVLAARPSMGKTALAMNIARNAAIRQKTVVVFSLEQSRDELLLRMIATQSAVELRAMRNIKNMVTESMEEAYKAADELAKMPIYIKDTPMITMQEIRSELLRHKLRTPLDLVIIDYLQIMGYNGKADSQTLRLGEITGKLKGIAKELNVPIVLLSQLNRLSEGRQDKRPVLSDLRDSGAIEQDADVVMMLHRGVVYGQGDEHEAELSLKKNRNGQTQTITLFWEGKHFRFTSWKWGTEE